jgi:hypothetical protein
VEFGKFGRFAPDFSNATASFPTSALFVGRECSFTPSSRLEFEKRILVDFA